MHFHEVGGLDAIVDVVGTCAALELLGVDEVHSSPIANGIGMVRAAHGLLPNPAPAVVELLRGAPTFGVDIAAELTTPTGAALLAANVSGWGPIPMMTIASTGFGAGTRELDARPNLTQVVIGALSESLQAGQPVTLLEVNVDDATGETLAHTISMLMEAGAHDAWVSSIVMKKGRPAHTVERVVRPEPRRADRAHAHLRDRFARRARADARTLAGNTARGRGRRRRQHRAREGRAGPDQSRA